MSYPVVKVVITKKSPDIIITEDDNNIVLDSTDGTSDAGGKMVGNGKVFLERFWDGETCVDPKIKFSGTYFFVPDALEDEDVGSKITLEEPDSTYPFYETPDNNRDGIAIWYWPNGRKKNEFTYVNGYLHGSCKQWYENGDPCTIGQRTTGLITNCVARTENSTGVKHTEETLKKKRENNQYGHEWNFATDNKSGTWKFYDKEGTETIGVYNELGVIEYQ